MDYLDNPLVFSYEDNIMSSWNSILNCLSLFPQIIFTVPSWQSV